MCVYVYIYIYIYVYMYMYMYIYIYIYRNMHPWSHWSQYPPFLRGGGGDC